LKVYFIVNNDLNYDQRMARICDSLSKENFDIHIVGRKKKNSKPLTNFNNYSTYHIQCIFNKGKISYLEFNLRLFIFLLFKKFDVISVVDLDTMIAGYFSHKIKPKSKLVFDAHELFTELPELENRPKTKYIWEKIEHYFLPKIKNGYTVNQSLSEYYNTKYNIKLDVIYNVPKISQVEKCEKKSPFILYQGAVNKGRGLKELISAIQHTHYKLVIAGEGDEYDSLKKFTQKLNISDKIEFTSYLVPEKLTALTQSAFIGVNLLENSSKNYYYSLANKFFDYIHAEIPQITMNFPEYKKFHNEKNVAILIDNLDETTILHAIEKLYKNEELYKEIKENCQLLKQKYHWENESKKLIQFYQKLS
jgi:glycosyltransferase involved in cell wall biosynthesis